MIYLNEFVATCINQITLGAQKSLACSSDCSKRPYPCFEIINFEVEGDVGKQGELYGDPRISFGIKILNDHRRHR